MSQPLSSESLRPEFDRQYFVQRTSILPRTKEARCEICSNVYANRNSLGNHVRRVHGLYSRQASLPLELAASRDLPNDSLEGSVSQVSGATTPASRRGGSGKPEAAKLQKRFGLNTKARTGRIANLHQEGILKEDEHSPPSSSREQYESFDAADFDFFFGNRNPEPLAHWPRKNTPSISSRNVHSPNHHRHREHLPDDGPHDSLERRDIQAIVKELKDLAQSYTYEKSQDLPTQWTQKKTLQRQQLASSRW
jgi:hypothetical protein